MDQPNLKMQIIHKAYKKMVVTRAELKSQLWAHYTCFDELYAAIEQLKKYEVLDEDAYGGLFLTMKTREAYNKHFNK